MILGLLLLSVVVSRVIYPYDVGYLEAFSWVPAGHLLEGKNPYSFATTPPYSMTPYGVIYYALMALGVKLFGLQIWFGRLLSVIAFAVCVWSVTRITRHLTNSKRASAVALLVSLALFPAQSWIAVMRSDLIAVAFAFAALALVFTSDEKDRVGPARVTWIVTLALAAFFTKHTVALSVLIIVLRFVQLNKLRDAYLFSALFLVLGGAVMFLLNYTSGGGYIWHHFIHASTLPFSFENFRYGVVAVISTPTFIVFAAALVVFLWRAKKSLRGGFTALRSGWSLIFLYLVLSFVAASISSGRVGSNVNYFLENSFVIAIVCGLIYQTLTEAELRKTATALILLMSLAGMTQLVRAARGEYFRRESLPYYSEISETAARHIRPGDDCVSVYAELVSRHGCRLYFDDYGEYIGGWSPQLSSLFEREVTAGRFSVIVWYEDNLHAKFPNYQLIRMSREVPEKFFPVYIYVRKN